MGSRGRHEPFRALLAQALASAALLATSIAAAQVDPERLLFPALNQQPPEAQALAAQADRARRLGDFASAADLYTRASEASPDYAPFARRVCGAEIARARREEAIPRCREAVRLDPSPENLLALASALGERSGPPRPEHAAEIEELIKRAVAMDKERYLVATCESLVVMSSTMSLAECMKPPLADVDPAAIEAVKVFRHRGDTDHAAKLLALAIVGAIIGFGFVVNRMRVLAVRRRRVPPELRDATRIVGPEHVLPGLERDHIARASDYAGVVEKILAITGDAVPEVDCVCNDWGEIRRMTLTVGARRFKADLQGNTAWIDLDPFLDLLNRVLRDCEAPGRLFPLSGGQGDPTVAIAYATDAQAAALRRQGLLTQPFSLPAEEVEELPCAPGSRVDLHANGRIARAALARDAAVRGIWCAGGTDVELAPNGALVQAVLARDHSFGGIAFPAGSRLAFEAEIPKEIVLGASCAIHGLDLPEGTRVMLDSAGQVAAAVAERDLVAGDLPCPAGTPIALEDGAWRIRLGPRGPYRA